MSRKANEVLNCCDPNPFSDSQARNYSDIKISSEFYPTHCFWDLFNDQHEMLLGTRGSGKTYLLKMMRRSMLKRINSPHARDILSKNSFFSLYVPMHLEILSEYKKIENQPERQVEVFQFFFNCILAEAIVQELKEFIVEKGKNLEAFIFEEKLAKQLDLSWFSNDSRYGNANNLTQLVQKIRNMYYSFDLVTGSLELIPTVFTRTICSSLISVKALISDVMGWETEPTWIVCVDEAEFLNVTLQKCINSMFRADSNRIALKVATLPFYHKTTETLVPGIHVSVGNDFCYRHIDMNFDSEEYKTLTNQLCTHRLKTRLVTNPIAVDSLEDFLGKIGNDDYVDYYRAEVGEEKATREAIEAGIVSSFSENRRKGAVSYSNKRKTIYDKFSTVFYVREMYKIAHTGHSKPGWFAGANVVRRVSQGNPRLFLQIMNALFEKARVTQLTPKAQHEVITKFANELCNSTKGLNADAYDYLDRICTYIHNKVHNKELTVTSGCAFSFTSKSHDDIKKVESWIEEAVAHSRLIVNDDVLMSGLSDETKFILSNAYAVNYWLPMRSDTVTKISIKALLSGSLLTNGKSQINHQQMSIFEEDT